MLALLMIMSAFAGCASNQNVAQDTTAAAVTEAPSDETAAPVVNIYFIHRENKPEHC